MLAGGLEARHGDFIVAVWFSWFFVATAVGQERQSYCSGVCFCYIFVVQRMGPTMVNCYVRGIIFICFYYKRNWQRALRVAAAKTVFCVNGWGQRRLQR